MKSYKDLPKDIILNAPERAMWYDPIRNGYYIQISDKMFCHTDDGKWEVCYDYKFSDWFPDENMIPLPNIEIPWEATKDSMGGGKCPVPNGTEVQVFFDDDENATDSNPAGWNWTYSNKRRNIVAYKIIDEEYLPSVATVTITEDSATVEPGVKVTVWETTEDKLIRRLEFLQNLANKFPEIRSEAIKFMSCELDGYMNTLWEKDNDE